MSSNWTNLAATCFLGLIGSQFWSCKKGFKKSEVLFPTFTSSHISLRYNVFASARMIPKKHLIVQVWQLQIPGGFSHTVLHIGAHPPTNVHLGYFTRNRGQLRNIHQDHMSELFQNHAGKKRQTVWGGRKSMYQRQAIVAMEQQQMRLDIIATAAAGPSM